MGCPGRAWHRHGYPENRGFVGNWYRRTAAFTTRYDIDLTVPISVTDDLGRIWTVQSARSIQDRRYLEYETFRVVTVLDAA